jgi:hypothetical protein
MDDALRKALDDLSAAVAFRDKVKAAGNAGEEVTSTGAFRDACDWINEASAAVVAAYGVQGGLPDAQQGGNSNG